MGEKGTWEWKGGAKDVRESAEVGSGAADATQRRRISRRRRRGDRGGVYARRAPNTRAAGFSTPPQVLGAPAGAASPISERGVLRCDDLSGPRTVLATRTDNERRAVRFRRRRVTIKCSRVQVSRRSASRRPGVQHTTRRTRPSERTWSHDATAPPRVLRASLAAAPPPSPRVARRSSACGGRRNKRSGRVRRRRRRLEWSRNAMVLSERDRARPRPAHHRPCPRAAPRETRRMTTPTRPLPPSSARVLSATTAKRTAACPSRTTSGRLRRGRGRR